MAQRAVGVTDVAPGAGVAEYRTRERSVSGATVVEQYLLYEQERVAACVAMATTFRTPGSGTAAQNLATLFNRSGSGVLVAVRRISHQVDYTTNSATVRVISTSRITTNPTTGTLHTPTLFDTGGSHAALVEFRGAASADGTASAITATAGTHAWRQFHTHFAAVTDLQQSRLPDNGQVPLLAETEPIILAEGEGLLIQITDTSSTSTHLVVNAVWEEFTLP